MKGTGTVEVELELPDLISKEEARVMLAIKLFEKRRLTLDLAAGVAGYSTRAFIDILEIEGFDVLDSDVSEPCSETDAPWDFTFQGRGRRVYGARCETGDKEWMYVNVRRLFIFLEASLDQGTQWSVFEPDDMVLWERLIQSVSNFLTARWREGHLAGATASEAFFVKCGYDTMSEDDIENGRLIMEVGVAPVFPAEFVVIRIGQWLGGESGQGA